MQKISRIIRTQAFRVFLLIAGIQTVCLGALAWAMITVHQSDLQEHVLLSGRRVTDLVIRSTQHSMLANDKAEAQGIVTAVGLEPGIEGIRIINKDGQVIFAARSEEIGRRFSMREEACAQCHDHNGLVIRGAEQGHSYRVFTKPGGGRVLSLSTVIRNGPHCSDASCHAHPATKRVLGIMDTEMSLAEVDRSALESRNRFVTLSLVAVLVVALVSGGFIWRFVRLPAKRLIEGMELASAGSLDLRLDVHSHDELGQVAGAFNAMMEELARARKEITEWSDTLEAKVKEKTADLERAHKRMVAVEKLASLGNLSASVAHEINNPLEGILTFAKLSIRRIQRLQLPAEAVGSLCADLELVAEEAQRCGDIVKNLLVFARQAPAMFQSATLSTIVRRCALLVKHYAEQHKVALTLHLSPDDTLICDPGQIQQVLMVLMVNGIEAISARPVPSQGGELRVESSTAVDGDMVIVKVTDAGVGIPDEILGNIFEPFFTTKTEGKGVGLGLSIAYGIVQRHRGTIEVETVPGQGSVFTLMLPRTQPLSTQAASVIGTNA
jgi:two-component system, NtrC family, sensor kinase